MAQHTGSERGGYLRCCGLRGRQRETRWDSRGGSTVLFSSRWPAARTMSWTCISPSAGPAKRSQLRWWQRTGAPPVKYPPRPNHQSSPASPRPRIKHIPVPALQPGCGPWPRSAIRRQGFLHESLMMAQRERNADERLPPGLTASLMQNIHGRRCYRYTEI